MMLLIFYNSATGNRSHKAPLVIWRWPEPPDSWDSQRLKNYVRYRGDTKCS